MLIGRCAWQGSGIAPYPLGGPDLPNPLPTAGGLFSSGCRGSGSAVPESQKDPIVEETTGKNLRMGGVAREQYTGLPLFSLANDCES